MLMGHPSPIIARGRENASQGGFEGLTPGQVSIVVQELVACDSEVEKALADIFEAVQKIAQAGPNAFHRVAVHTGTVRVTTSILASAMVDCPMVIVGLGKMIDVVYLLYLLILTPVTYRNILLLPSLPSSILYRQNNGRKRKDAPRVGTAAKGSFERLSRCPR